MRQQLEEFRHNQWVYLVYALSLLTPGRKLPVFGADQLEATDVSGWTAEELKLLIEEGRRQSDRQQVDLTNIRGRAQWLFTVAVAALAALGAGLASGHPGTVETVLWLGGLVLLIYGVAGAASVMVSRADFSAIHTAVLSAQKQPIDRALAQAYARMMAGGENTVATRLTVFRQSVVFCLVGGYLGLIAALMTG
jgi:hypothetical protein